VYRKTNPKTETKLENISSVGISEFCVLFVKTVVVSLENHKTRCLTVKLYSCRYNLELNITRGTGFIQN
jgi:hypothetical protein